MISAARFWTSIFLEPFWNFNKTDVTTVWRTASEHGERFQSKFKVTY